MYNIQVVLFIVTTMRTSYLSIKENFLVALLEHMADLWYDVASMCLLYLTEMLVTIGKVLKCG
jgi:hypothetical protein